MDRTFAATVAAAVLLVAGGVGAGVLLSGTGAFDEPLRVDPALAQFSAGNATCVAAPVANVSAQVQVQDDSSFLVVDRNATVPGRGYTVGNATFRRVGLANYTLSTQTVQADGGRSGDCPDGETPVVPVRATVQLPHSEDEPYRVTVVHGGDVVAVVRNDPGGLTVEQVDAGGSAG